MPRQSHLPTIAALAAFAGFAAAPASAQDQVGDPVAGRALAERVCAECHAVAKDDRRGALPDPPAFQSLAEDPAMTSLALQVFLATPHADMPDLMLTGAETDDIIAYIHSLKPGGR